MRLVHAFGEQASKSPVRHRFGNIEHGLAALVPTEVNVGVRVAVELAGAVSAAVVGRAAKARQLAAPAAVYLAAATAMVKLLEVGDSRLF